ncbi:Molybdopterin synthase sulfur carrier subunit [Habropoda laboriosa]|uniref:Molybdopterin synthase sulfur carrier subunit n=1 Tax=Habropoda laboriosa TaxID=597456 RepID=A0A0L7QTU1_9HYME|nr:Molybdopterin synthase sulfur carrier subunit [Habropoda laboriosa]
MDDSTVETQVKILFFAKARELTGKKECYITVPKKLSYNNLRDRVISQYKLEDIRDTLILAVNEEFVSSNATLVLSEKDEIAVIPPLSGGLFYL